MTELKGEVGKGKETVVDPNVKLKAAEKRAENFAYERVQQALQQSQREHEKVCEIITCVQGRIDCFNAALMMVWKYMERWADEEDRKMLNGLGS